MESIASVLIGLVIAWFIVNLYSVRRSTFLERLILHPADVEESSSMQNPALIGSGLASAKPSVMDASPMAKPVMMHPQMPMPVQPQIPMPVQPQMPMPVQPQMPVPVQPVSMTASPISITQAPSA